MTGPAITMFILPRDVLETQLSMVDLLQAMYPATEQTDSDYSMLQLIERLREWCEPPGPLNTALAPDNVPTGLALTVTIPLDTGTDSSPETLPHIQLNVTVPLYSSEKQPTEPPPLTYSIRQPLWMSRAEVTELGSAIPSDDILAAFDYILENAPKYYTTNKVSAQIQQQDTGPLLRVWFYFPSLSTREKRKDLVNYAASYHLTGFVLAGKPGVLCLEGTSKDVDDYMNAIKNESWGDIPSHQKKVSERFREECGEQGRKFEGMKEITDDLGERRGTRKNRGDMAALESWLNERGVGAAFERVIMGA